MYSSNLVNARSAHHADLQMFSFAEQYAQSTDIESQRSATNTASRTMVRETSIIYLQTRPRPQPVQIAAAPVRRPPPPQSSIQSQYLQDHRRRIGLAVLGVVMVSGGLAYYAQH